MGVFEVLVALVVAWLIWRSDAAQRLAARARGVLGRGAWRPAAAVIVVGAVVGAAALALRGAWPVSLALLATALWVGLFIRREVVRTASDGPMSRSEAAALLGVSVQAPPAEVREAYRRLMQRAHPDSGGTQGLAVQLNRARDVMLKRP